MNDTTALSTDKLRYDSVDVEAIHFNFGAGFGETWEEVLIPHITCLSCDFVGQDDVFEEGGECPKCQSVLERPEFAPMMNYYYRLPNYEGDRDPEADQLLLYQSSVSVVIVMIRGGEYLADTYALALSGGGMDLSWDICHAFILLGYVPPLFACDVPEFAGQDNSKEPFWSILKACLQSAESAKRQAQWTQSKLAKLVDNALSCSGCGHYDPHNRIGGCTHFDFVGDNERCLCLQYLEGRPADEQAVREMANV